MKKRVAILGGGMGALATAYELTRRAGHRDRFEITVYQMGHRLGGKGASSVDPRKSSRIEEHGLHVLWGFYDNVFRMMRECYVELGRGPGAELATWDEALLPTDRFVVPERTASGWDYWTIESPRHDGRPGDPPERVDGPSALRSILHAARTLVAAALPVEPTAAVERALGAALPDLRGPLRALAGEPRESAAESAIVAIEARLRRLIQGTASGMLQGSRAIQDATLALLDLDLAELVVASSAADGAEARADRGAAVRLFRFATSHVFALAEMGRDDRRRRVLLDLLLSAARGMITDDLLGPERDWFRIDDEDFRAWLRRHGARPETVESPLLDGLYAALFADAGAGLGAGTLLHGLERLVFSRRGSILYLMRAGMGETVFAPLYQVLSARGVRFAFFHTVDRLELSTDRRRVERLLLDRVATPREGRYQPLVDVGGLPCWPVEPLYDQLVEGEALRASGADLENWWSGAPRGERVTLEAGRDFDALVLGISLGAFRDVCADLLADEGNPRFSAMVRHVATTQTQAAQLWFRPVSSRLGRAGAGPPIVIPYERPFDGYADMSHLLARERWEGQVGSLAYLTGRLEDDEAAPPRGPSDYPERQRLRVRANLERWLGRSSVGLWPAAAGRHDPAELNWAWLADPADREGAARLDAQYWCATKNPSDRYVLSLPGTNRHRLRADESGYGNLFLAGDWTRTSMSGGCLEGAVMGGIQAARAIDPGARAALGDWLEALDRPARPRPGAVPPEPSGALRTASCVAEQAGSGLPARDLPRYVARDGELLALPPIGLDITMHAFLLAADSRRIGALCDAELNLGGPTRYRPLGPLAVLYFAHVDNHPLEDPHGWVPEVDVGIWLPLVAGRSRAGRFEPERVVLYTPYIWVDHPLALTIGRAVYGFKKELAEIAMPPRAPGPTSTPTPLPHDTSSKLRFSVDTWVVPRFADRALVEKRRLLEVKSTEASPWQRAKTQVQGGAQLLRGLLGGLGARRSADEEPWDGTLDLVGRMLGDARRGVRMVYLKQLPDATDARRACYQAVLEADVAFTGAVVGAPLPGAFELSLATFDSHRIAETLGLHAAHRDADRVRISPSAAAWSSFEARIAPGTVMWESR